MNVEPPQLTIRIDTAEMMAAADRIPDFDARIKRSLRRALEWSVYEIQKELTDRVPKVTHTLERSWSPTPIEETPTGFTGGVGSNLVYAPVIEFGFHGTVRAHVRRVRSRDISVVTGVVSATDRRGRTRTREVREFQAMGITHVKSYHRDQDEKPYVRPGMAAALPKIQTLVQEGVNEAMEGKA